MTTMVKDEKLTGPCAPPRGTYSSGSLILYCFELNMCFGSLGFDGALCNSGMLLSPTITLSVLGKVKLARGWL
jgi:hypothetical protein